MPRCMRHPDDRRWITLNAQMLGKPVQILLVEDNPGDVRLTQEALKDSRMLDNLHIAKDGLEAMAFLHREGRYTDAPRPDLVLLDLNLPKKAGREVLAEIRADESLRRIPVVVLTTSQDEEDIIKAYNLNANCYITKPVELEQFFKVVKSIVEFWFTVVKLPGE